MAKRAKKPAAKKEKYRPIPGSAVADSPGTLPGRPADGRVLEYDPPKPGPELEEMTEAEVEAMEKRSIAKKEAVVARVEAEVDAQDWSLMDPVIPENLVGRVWIAVFRCPEGHKTKATNRQAESGVLCWKHREAGHKVKAEIMPQFLNRPVSDDPEAAKREKSKKAAKGAQ